MTREFARQRICRNILPGTGPVGAGGDQGRDFETYKTYLDDLFVIDDTKLFEGVSKDGNVFFACSLQEKIAPKIKFDIKSIFSHTQEKRPVIYFCVEDVSIAKRNELIKWCRCEYGIDLQILDGRALSENLSDPDIFWIAEQYLHIPSEMYPTPTNDDEYYEKYRERWVENNEQPYNFSDFHEIKYGLRKATFEEKLKPDLVPWLNTINKFLSDGGDYIKSRVQYEICVAALRGQNNLNAYKDIIRDYFKDIEEIQDPAKLTDVGVLLMYCSGAKHLGQLDIEASYLHDLSRKYMDRTDYFLENTIGINTRCSLLENKARAFMFPHLESVEPNIKIDKTFECWQELVDTVEKAALFPLEHFSDTLAVLTPMIGKDPRFLKIAHRVDQLLAERAGGFTAAAKCRDRAVAFYDNNQILLAIDHLHRAKINWFSAETLRGTIIASRFIAEAYSELGLMYAAKLYLLSALFLAFHSRDDDVQDYISKSFFQIAEMLYKSGEWLTFFSVMELALLSHHHYDSQPLIFDEHDNRVKVFIYGTIVRTLSQRFWPEVSKHVEVKFSKWALDQKLREELTLLVDEQDESSYWKKTSIEDIWLQLEENLSGKPFNDVGEVRKIGWKALGVEWEVCFENSYELTRVVEEFVAILQVVLADLAMDDLQVLPVKVKINAYLTKEDRMKFSEQFDSKKLEWDVELPRFKDKILQEPDYHTQNTLAYALSVLGYCTTLSQKEFQQKIKTALENDLISKTFFTRPYPELYREVLTSKLFMEEEKNTLDVIEPDRIYNLHEYPELTWNNDDGKFFSTEEATKYVQNRYNRLSLLMSVVWPKILSSDKHRSFFEELKKKGYKDWHLSLIVCNAVANYVARKKVWTGFVNHIYMQKLQETIINILNGKLNEEIYQLNIDEIDAENFQMHDKTSFASMMKTWGLVIHAPVPNFQAIKQFMRERYKVFETDVPHDALFTE
ncbi:hypothetical protein [Dethiosulfatarculus sandiegensis]|nr:hypothetical protein [Dethiosulfatarculus sandiegensis]